MIDLSSAPRARLITAFGTVLYLDPASGELRHGDVATSPANAYFVADQRPEGRPHGLLIYDSAEKRHPIRCLADRSHVVPPAPSADQGATPTLLELIPLERGLIAFKSGNVFLSAIPDGSVRLSASRCSTWELFLASEDWCSDVSQDGGSSHLATADANVDQKQIQSYIVHPLIRVRANTKPKNKKILIYGYTKWSHGRVHYDLCKHLHRRGYIVDILDWQVNHTAYIKDIISYYDLFVTACDGAASLIDIYGVPFDRTIVVSHHEFDIRMLIEQKGIDVFDKFANYGVVGEFVYCASLMRGVTRIPMVASLGINYSEFYSEIPERLATVGYASSMSVKTYGVEWKRGELAQAAALEAGLAFKVAGWTGKQMSFHDMPDFYRSVDAVVTSSISEAAQLPVMEAAAAGRLVIGTPVGHFPRKAYEGGGIVAPIEAEKFKAFAAEQLRYYKEHPAAYIDKCRSIQEAARKFDWQHSIGEWIELIEATTTPEMLFERARSLQASGNFGDAALLFSQVADADSSREINEELAWCAEWQKSRCHRDLAEDEKFVDTALAVFRRRPHRAEPLCDLANFYLSKQRALEAALYAEAALSIPKPDVLLVDPDLYDFGLRHLFAVAANWSQDPQRRERGRTVCDWLALSRDVPEQFRMPALYNSGWFAPAAQSLLPSMKLFPLSIDGIEGFHPANTGICRDNNKLIALVRTVNWILSDGKYLLLAGQPTYKSRILLLELDSDLQTLSCREVLPPDNLPPPRSNADLGFRDPRPFIWRGQLWCICAFRERNPEAIAEMVLARVDRTSPERYVFADWHLVPSGMPVKWEGNWMPGLIGDELRLIYSVDPTRILTETGTVLYNQPTTICADSFRGGSQAVPFDDGWLMVIHEVEHVNGGRRYFHRFIWMDRAHSLQRLSRRFYFHELGYEFVSGMAWHQDETRLILSLSVNDAHQFLAVVLADDVRRILLDMGEHERASEASIAASRLMLETLTSSPGKIELEGQPRTSRSWRIEGPLDSTYSLAVVNREIALALADLGEEVTVESRDPAPFPPSDSFLAQNPRIAAMLEAAGSGVVPDVVLRNTWPPRVDDMTGRLRGLVCYAWEETGFPLDDVHAFNSNLQFITVTSRFVAKTLRDNGIHVPIYVIGNGIDQIARLKEPSAIDLIREKFAIEDKFCFLHISTCLPRKGVDVLLAAWARAFSRDDDVILVIKGTDSSHFRHVEGLVAALRATQPRHAPVVLIKDDLSNADLAALYHIADVVASPSRGEGFGLPLAEAFAIGKPVITTAFGGQMDFCSSDNAWLCDYDFAYAQSYVSVPGSVWAEPRVDSLVDCMRRARSATALERSNRGELGRTAIETQYSWKSVAQRLRCLVAHASGSNAPNAKRPKLAFVSPWNTSSRIAEYGHLLVSRIPGERLVILASLGPGDDYHDQAATYRCWNEGAAFPVEELRRILHAEAVDAVAIQFNLDSGQVRSLGTLIDLITQDRVAVYLILYSDFQDDCTTVTHLSAIRDTLRGVQRLFVHSVDALNQLKALDLIDNATLLPFATAATPEAEKLAERFDSLIRGDFLQRAVDNGSACIPISVLSSPSNACNKLSDQSARPPRNAENQVSFSDYRRARIRNLRAMKRLDLELFLHPDPDIVSECIDRFGHWEWTETQYVVDTIKEGDVVLDLGANLGYYTALFSRLVGERGKVYAFEPDDDNFHLLMLNIKHNRLANVLAMKAMVGRSSGIAALHLHNSENRGAHMAANLNHPNFESVAYHPQVTLDELRRVGALDRVDFIKMDTQGAEPDIVAGAREVIETNCAHLNMVVEFMPDWIERFHKRQAIDFYRELCGFGFDCFYVHPMRQEILPVTDPAELITTVTACDGIAWPERVNFVDLIMKPSARPLQSK